MLSELRKNVFQHMRENVALYLVALFAMLVGLTTGAFSVATLSETQTQYMKDFLAAFLSTVKNENINVWRVLLQSFINNMQILILIGGLGLFMVGFPFIIVLVAVKGLLIGFTLGILTNVLGFKGFLIFILCVLPANLILIPCFLRGSVLALSSSVSKFKNRRNPMASSTYSPQYYKQFIAVVIATLVGVLIEGILQPLFISIFA